MKHTPPLAFGWLFILITVACGSPENPEAELNQSVDPKLSALKWPSGFRIEHLYSPSEHEQGSWVAMTFDHKDRLIVSDQFGALYRMEIPPAGADTLTPIIEELAIPTSGTETTADTVLQMGYAQGLLWAFNSLYVMVNNHEDEEFEKSSGLYRLQDTNHDDQFDKVTLLKSLEGAGEHGPHSIVKSPDGQSLYVIAGNHTDMPEMDAYRLPHVWQDDNLFPLIKDPRGHANDRGAPGGWIARIDSLGERWEMVAAGFRNPFDLAFNEAGDMFTFDSDMEWDLGMPWYRPTRICHVTSGAEFGWRTGSGKWSPAYPDNLPPVLNVGQGSPTGVLHGQHARFPAPYQKALFAFDWSFGIIYAIHLKPDGASYTAEREEFISGMPLPLTDGVIGPDGAMYFMTGGRKLDSDVYRVYYEGDAQLSSLTSNNTSEAPSHQIRTTLETYHHTGAAGGVDVAWPYLKHDDRFVRYAARIAIEHQPVREWQEQVLAADDPVTLTQGIIALARHGEPQLRDTLVKKLCSINYQALTDQQKVDLLRALELTVARMGPPSEENRQATISYLRSHYPANQDVLNASLGKLLVAMDDPEVVETTLTLLEKDEGEPAEQADAAVSGSDLILRNPQYGIDIARMLKDVPPTQQTYYATILSKQRSGWTADQRERYFRWFYQAFDFEGGNSYIGFIDKARQQALSRVPKDEFDYYNTLSGDSLIGNDGKDLADVPQPEGPYRRWETEEALAVLDSATLQPRDFENGKNMYTATRCATCHSMRGAGGIIGPNLTQLGTRFSIKDMLMAIMEPSEVVSDQYASTVFYLEDGQSVVGKLTHQDEDTYYLSQNPFAPDAIREIPKSEVTESKLSAVSVMPPNLIYPLNEEELRDLMAYLMAGGDPNHPVYRGEKAITEAR